VCRDTILCGRHDDGARPQLSFENAVSTCEAFTGIARRRSRGKFAAHRSAGVVFTCARVRTPAGSPQRRWGISPNRRQSQGASPATQALTIRYLADGLLLGTA
jgi:hypothetical protein